jgi:hypothetical protein
MSASLPPHDDYDPAADLTASIELAYQLVRARVAAGGRGWGGWPESSEPRRPDAGISKEEICMGRNADYQSIWDEALRAAQIAAEAELAKGPRPGDGCAFLDMPRSLPFADWAATALDPIWEDGEVDNPHPDRLWLGDAQFSFACDDSLDVHMAAANAACAVLSNLLPTSAIIVIRSPG